MLVEIKVPVLAESVADATLLDWHKNKGDVVRRGDNLIDLETDKVTLEVVAQNNGVLTEVRKQTGDTVVADEILAVIDTDAEVPAASTEPGAADASAAGAGPAAATDAPKAAPAAKKIAKEAGVELSSVNGTGRDGRITKKDVLKVIEGGAAEAPAAEAPVADTPAVVPAVAESSERVEERVPMTRLRKRAAERLLGAQQENAILTTFNEVNMQPVLDLRNRYRDEFEKQHDVKMGFMGFFVKAAIEALKRYPVVNASVDGDQIIYHGFFDIGIAVGSDRGLVVPILRDANYLSFSDIERRIRDFGERARDGKLTIDELTGGTFTITNGGVYGSLLSTPIINPPQSGILGMHKIQQRPVVEDGEIVARPMMYLALSYDHRIIDGREAVQFLVTIKEQLEDPSRMLLQI